MLAKVHKKNATEKSSVSIHPTIDIERNERFMELHRMDYSGVMWVKP